MNLRQLKKKIKSIQNVGQITKAMQLVSAVKMKKAQARAVGGKPYRTALEETIAHISASAASPLATKSSAKRELVIVISSNKGLCGVFNFNLMKMLHREIMGDVERYDFITLGTKAQQFLSMYGAHIIADFSTANRRFEDSVTAIYTLAREEFLKGKYSTVSIMYNSFVSSLQSQARKDILLPVTEIKKEQEVGQSDYLIEPDPQTVLNGIIDFYLEQKIRGSILESEASEHSARMVAMKNATDNARELVRDMTLLRNGLRQERITNELLDMNTARLAVTA